jgi:hypothetical protein
MRTIARVARFDSHEEDGVARNSRRATPADRLREVAGDADQRVDDVVREQGKRAEDRDRDDGDRREQDTIPRRSDPSDTGAREYLRFYADACN